MKRSPINPVGKVGKRRAANLAKWKRQHPCPMTCPECGMAPDFRGMAPDWRGFSVHHKRKRSQLGDESGPNLRWLCGVCHDKEHGINDVQEGKDV